MPPEHHLEEPTFAQVIIILKDVMHRHPGTSGHDLIELTKRRHLELGFAYHNAQIHRADDALDYLVRSWRSSSTSRPATRQSNRRGRK